VSRIALERADTEPVGFDERLSLEAGSLGDDVVSVRDVSISGVIRKDGDSYALVGRIRGEGALRCVRCLETFPFSFSESLSLHLVPLTAAPHEEETQLQRADLDNRFYDAPEVDLDEIGAEQFVLAVPMKPLCSESCLGLCPKCGTNLNRGQCSCPVDVDQRWQPLAAWRSTN
jgi:uncharacterized protein